MEGWDKLLWATLLTKFLNCIRELIRLRTPKSKEEEWNGKGVLVRRIIKYR